jgi:hypothetical protein
MSASLPDGGCQSRSAAVEASTQVRGGGGGGAEAFRCGSVFVLTAPELRGGGGGKGVCTPDA